MSTFVKTIADIQLGVKVEGDTRFEAVDPYLISAEENYLKDYLGAELFAAMGDPGYNPDKLAKVSNPIKIAVSCFAFYHLINEGSLKLNEHGAKESSNDLVAAPAKWRDDNQKAELVRRGDIAIDNLLDILMSNPDDYPEWASSRWYKMRTTLLISTAKVFDEYVPIGKSTRVFLRLLPDLRKSNSMLSSYICSELPARLMDHLADPETDEPAVEAIDALMPYVQEVIAYDTIIRAIPRFNFFNTPIGIIFYTIDDSTMTKTAISSTDKKELKASYQAKLDESIATLRAYLGQNLSDFPEYANSSCAGKVITSTPAYAFENKCGQKFFAP